jgi:hypothetical protein
MFVILVFVERDCYLTASLNALQWYLAAPWQVSSLAVDHLMSVPDLLGASALATQTYSVRNARCNGNP